MADKKKWPWFCPLICRDCEKDCWCYEDDECKNPMLNEDKKLTKTSIQAKYKK